MKHLNPLQEANADILKLKNKIILPEDIISKYNNGMDNKTFIDKYRKQVAEMNEADILGELPK